MWGRLFTSGAIAIAALLVPFTGVQAARPILDYHRLDAYFALFASDSNVPWKTATVRVDTYTDAALDFSAYSADPADVIVAGSNAETRAIDTRKLTPIARWRFTPPPGYRFQSSTVVVPVGAREGFFVIEARRGNIAEQVWMNRTRVGLLAKQTASSVALYGSDLGSGEPLARMRVSFLIGRRFIDRFTDRNGLILLRNLNRPSFALASWGNSIAFISFLPQPPLARSILALKTSSAVIRAGDTLHAIGFGRMRAGTGLRPSIGDVRISLHLGSSIVARSIAHFDSAGAFSTEIGIPHDAVAGNYTLIADAAGATGAAAVSIESNTNGIALRIRPACDNCDTLSDLPVFIDVARNGQPIKDAVVDVNVIRSPHVLMDEAGETWGMAPWFTTRVVSDELGHAQFEIPHPTDGLSSTYGIRASSGGTEAQTRAVVSTAPVALAVTLQRAQIGAETPASFSVLGHDLTSGRPASNLPVIVQLIHGASIQQQSLSLDAHGYATGAFTLPQTGFSLLVASAQGVGWRAADAAQLQVADYATQSVNMAAGAIALTFDREHYVAGQAIAMRVQSGGSGVVLFTLESGGQLQFHEAPIRTGIGQTSFRIPAGAGSISAAAAFVHDGALQTVTAPVKVDAPGRPFQTTLSADHNGYPGGATATVQLDGVEPGWGTVVARITQSMPSGAALFDDAPEALSFETAGTESSAPASGTWHSWVSSNGTPAVAQTFARRGNAPADLTMTGADTANIYWKMWRTHDSRFAIVAPQTPGRYELSLLKIDDDGSVTSASGILLVEAAHP